MRKSVMKANELRIGNYVNDSIGLITIGLNGNIKFADAYHPIPLTEEWLLKFGFNEVFMVDGVWGYGIDGFIYVNSGQIRFNGKAILLNENQLQHVNQLQNLYFALTGEELTIKER
jgi:hypothetical protein